MTSSRMVLLMVLGAIFVALGAVTYLYQRDIEQARERVASGSLIAQTACGPIEYAKKHGVKPYILHQIKCDL